MPTMSQESPPLTSPPANDPRAASGTVFGWRGAIKLVAVAATVLVAIECASFAVLYASG